MIVGAALRPGLTKHGSKRSTLARTASLKSSSKVTRPVAMATGRLSNTNCPNPVSSFAFGETFEMAGRSLLAFLLEGAEPAA
jgi:hypothetical protein